MELKRRNPNFLIEMVIAFFIIFSPIIVVNSFFSISAIPNLLIFGLSIFACSYYFKRKSLSEEEINYIENNAIYSIEQKITNTDFLNPLLFLFFILVSDSKEEAFNFWVSIVSFLYFSGKTIQSIVQKTNFILEKVLFLPTQIVYIYDIKKVINIAEINVLKLTASSLHLNTMHGSLDVKIKKLPQGEKEELMLYLNKIASQTAAIPERIIISL